MARLLVFLIPLLLLSCVAPADYNDSLIREQRQVLAVINELNTAIKQGRVAETTELLEKSMGQVEKSILKVQQKDAFRGEVQLRDEMEELLKFYRFVLNEYYPLLIEIHNDEGLTPAEKKEVADSIYDIMREQEHQRTASYAAAQKLFAEKYNISIISTQK
jgi:hypothetical protein